MVVRRRGGPDGRGRRDRDGVARGLSLAFSQTQQWAGPLLIGALLGLVAVGSRSAWRDARTPLLVADETGLRVRLGRRWTGVPWEQVERVEVEARGRSA